VIVVSDSSPLIALARIGRLDLLAGLYGRILIPPEVRDEVTLAGRGLPGAKQVQSATWIEVAVRHLPVDTFIERACQILGAGELGAILLARSINADLTLIDESKARRVARDAGLSVMGCIGILELGWKRGVVSDLRQAYIELLRQGIRLDLKLLESSLAKCGLPGL
jgi:predicted nucleic acid-binding protein